MLREQSSLKKLSLSYTPDFNIYHNAPDESYNAHKIGDVIKANTGDFSFSLDNAFLYNDGNKEAATYVFTAHLGVNIIYAYNLGDNALAHLPANIEPGYRGFDDQQVSVGVQWKF